MGRRIVFFYDVAIGRKEKQVCVQTDIEGKLIKVVRGLNELLFQFFILQLLHFFYLLI
jgi:hypothetical protein